MVDDPVVNKRPHNFQTTELGCLFFCGRHRVSSCESFIKIALAIESSNMQHSREDEQWRQWVYKEVIQICDECPVNKNESEIGKDLDVRLERADRLWERDLRRRSHDVHIIVARLTRSQLQHIDDVLAELGDDFDADFYDTSEMGGFFGMSKKKRKKLAAKKPTLIVCDCGGLCGEVALMCRLRRWALEEFADSFKYQFTTSIGQILYCEGERTAIFGTAVVKDIRFAPLKMRTRKRRRLE